MPMRAHAVLWALALHACTRVAEGMCNYNRLDNSISKDLAEDLLGAGRKFGCYYDHVSCTISPNSHAKCELSKSTTIRNNRRSCNVRLLTRSIERGIIGEIRSAERYGCEVASVECNMDSRKWVSCTSTPSQHDSGSHFPAPSSSSGRCDLNILETSMALEIESDMRKSMRKFDCPRLQAVRCKKLSSFDVDCDIEIDQNARIGSACMIDRVTRDLTHELGELLLDANVKYGCTFPPFVNCLNSPAGFTCGVANSVDRAEKKERHHRRQREHADTANMESGTDRNAQARGTNEDSRTKSDGQKTNSGPQSANRENQQRQAPPRPPPPPPRSSEEDTMNAHGRAHRVFRHHHRRDREF